MNALKEKAAAFIDEVRRCETSYKSQLPAGIPADGEIMRLFALAATEAESAAMWGVKAVTKPVR